MIWPKAQLPSIWAVVAVSSRMLGPGGGIAAALLDGLQVAGDAQHAVGVVAHQVAHHQGVGHVVGYVRGGPRPPEYAAGKRLQLGCGKYGHGCPSNG